MGGLNSMKNLKNELQNLIFGNESKGRSKSFKKFQLYLRRNEKASSVSSKEKYFKKEEAIYLSEFITKEDFWFESEISSDNYLTEGAEQKVYRLDDQYVIKLNDAIFYESWSDYFNSLLIHNYFFPSTEYELLGFRKINEELHSVVKQKFITSTEIVDLEFVELFLSNNHFERTRNNDYFNQEIGLIFEDLHDENIISNNGILYFIDTVFYLTPEFYQS